VELPSRNIACHRIVRVAPDRFVEHHGARLGVSDDNFKAARPTINTGCVGVIAAPASGVAASAAVVTHSEVIAVPAKQKDH